MKSLKDTAEALGMRLRWVRDALDLAPQDIAARVGVHVADWWAFEGGWRLPDGLTARRMCDALQISLGYLLNGELHEVETNLAKLLADDHPELVRPPH